VAPLDLAEQPVADREAKPVRRSMVSARTGLGACLRIATFFLLAAGVLAMTHFLVNTGLRRIDTSTFGVSNQIVSGEVNADILITGSSRALTHYDSRIIQAQTGEATFNIGLNGSQTDMQVALLKTYLQHNKRPALLIHNLDLFSFQVTHGGVYEPGQYLPYVHETPLYEALVRINPEFWKCKYLPLYGYAVEDMRLTWTVGLRGLFGWSPPEDRHLGFMPRDTAWTGEFDQFKRAHPQGLKFDVEPFGVGEINELLELCQRERIRVLLVYSPEYSEMQKLENNRDEIFNLFREIARRHQATFWDYSRSPICSEKELFYNSQHLNAEGAELFSNDLAARISSDPVFGQLVGSLTRK